MSRIRDRNTKPEIIVRSLLHQTGFRFRINTRDLPGRPDIVLPKYRTIIFVHGCFWHRHRCCKDATTPKTRVTFWIDKFANNVQRDRKVQKLLRVQGWQVLVIWECQTKHIETLARRLDKLLNARRRALLSVD